MEAILNAASDTALELGKSASADRQATLATYIDRIDLKENGVEIAIRRASLVPATLDRPVQIPADACITLTAATARVRRGHEVRLIIQPARVATPVARDARLAALLAEAHAARAMMLAQPEWSINQIALAQGKCRAHYAQLIRLSYLAPDIVAMILEGRQPESLDRRKLMSVDLPLAWADQRIALGCR